MPVIVEKDGHQRQMGDPEYKRLKGQGKLNGYSLVKNVDFSKAKVGAPAAQPEKVTLPEEVTKFQQKTVAEREQDALNKAYISMGEKGKLFEHPEDYTGDPALLKISPLPSAAQASPAADAKAEQPAENKAPAPQKADAENAAKAQAGSKATQGAAQAKKTS